jgi:hypothetical protein
MNTASNAINYFLVGARQANPAIAMADIAISGKYWNQVTIGWPNNTHLVCTTPKQKRMLTQFPA